MSGRYKTLQTEIDFPQGERWLQREAVQNSEQNAKQKRIALEQFDDFLTSYGFDSLESVDNTVLEDFSVWLDDERGHAHSTLSHRWYAVRAYLNKHVEDGLGYLDVDDEWILSWIDQGTETVKQQDRDVHWLPLDTIEQLIEGAKNLKNRLVIELLWNTGCRPSEISRMKLRRLNRDGRSIEVKTSKVQDSDAPNYERTVFYSRSMRKTMREWLDRGGRDSHPFADDSPYLVVGYNTPSIDARQINKIVRMAAEEAGIQEDMIQRSDDETNYRVTPKTLRHSFAVHSVRGRDKSGSPPIDLERLRRLMGHSSLEVTRHYLQYRESELRDAYDASHPA
ncbi:MAG: tyrosine-type recombinase/integrase [Halobacteriaceae archaeon]